MALLSLLAKLGLDKTGFDAGMSAANRQVAGFGANLKSQLGAAFGAGALIALARETIQYGDSIKELSERLGVSSREAQEFGLAAKLGGADAAFFATKFEKLKAAMSGAIGGGKNPFAAFGLGVEQLGQMKPAQVLKVLADQINDIGVSADKNNKFVEIFGRGGSKMISILGDLQNAKTGTLFFTDEDLEKLTKADNLFVKIGNNLKVAAAAALNFWGYAYRVTGRADDLIMGRTPAAEKPKPIVGENQILTDLEAEDEARKVHMAVMDRALALDKEAIRLEGEAHKAGLSDAQRKNELLKERITLMENLRTMVGEMPAAEEEARAMMRKRLAEVNLDITRIDQQKPAERARTPASIENTKLGNIGATLGSTGANRQMETLVTAVKRVEDALVRRGIIIQQWR